MVGLLNTTSPVLGTAQNHNESGELQISSIGIGLLMIHCLGFHRQFLKNYFVNFSMIE